VGEGLPHVILEVLRSLGRLLTGHRRPMGRIVVVVPESTVVAHEANLSTVPFITDPIPLVVKAGRRSRACLRRAERP